MKKLLIENIGMLATPKGKTARKGSAQGEIQILRDAWVLIEGGHIAAVGEGEPPQDAAIRHDAGGRLVTPGLVDAHTHLIFGGWRQDELGLKLHGVSYLEILAQGGGILSTVKATREATEESLFEKAWDALDEMMDFYFGATVVDWDARQEYFARVKALYEGGEVDEGGVADEVADLVINCHD